MNRKFFLISFLFLSTFAVKTFATPIELLHCHIPSKENSNNIQCAYSVTGQKIEHPEETSQLYVNTNMPYAFCSHTLCEVDSTHPSSAICLCPVLGVGEEIPLWEKVSVGPVFFEVISPLYKKEILESVPSNFSLAYNSQNKKLKSVTCQFDQPVAWANCFGRRCDVSYQVQNGKPIPIAKCQCKIIKTNTFISFGPKNKNECMTLNNKVWSAMTEKQADNNMNVILDSYQRFFPQSPPIKNQN